MFAAKLIDGGIGWGYNVFQTDATIFFPMSPRAIFFAVPKKPAWSFMLSDKEVKLFNQAIAWNAYQQIYAPELRTEYKELSAEISKTALTSTFAGA